MAFEYRTIGHSTSFWPFEYRTIDYFNKELLILKYSSCQLFIRLKNLYLLIIRIPTVVLNF